jgi:hypothetical protein
MSTMKRVGVAAAALLCLSLAGARGVAAEDSAQPGQSVTTAAREAAPSADGSKAGGAPAPVSFQDAPMSTATSRPPAGEPERSLSCARIPIFDVEICCFQILDIPFCTLNP